MKMVQKNVIVLEDISTGSVECDCCPLIHNDVSGARCLVNGERCEHEEQGEVPDTCPMWSGPLTLSMKIVK